VLGPAGPDEAGAVVPGTDAGEGVPAGIRPTEELPVLKVTAGTVTLVVIAVVVLLDGMGLP